MYMSFIWKNRKKKKKKKMIIIETDNCYINEWNERALWAGFKSSRTSTVLKWHEYTVESRDNSKNSNSLLCPFDFELSRDSTVHTCTRCPEKIRPIPNDHIYLTNLSYYKREQVVQVGNRVELMAYATRSFVEFVGIFWKGRNAEKKIAIVRRTG